MTAEKKAVKELLAEIEELRLHLEEAQETLRAIGSGEVDAFVVSGPEGPQVFTLKGAEQPYRVLVETMNEGAATLTSDGTILYCNNRLADMLQSPLETLIGTRLDSYVASSDRAIFADRLGKCPIKSDRVEIVLMPAGGNPISVLFSCFAMEIQGALGIGALFADMRAQKEIEALVRQTQLQASIAEERELASCKLRESEERMQQALRVSRSFTFDWEPATDQVLRSESCAAILALSGDEAFIDSGRNFFQRIHPEDRDRFIRMLRELNPTAAGYTTEYRVVRVDGIVISLEETGQATFDADGNLQRVVGVATDISARKLAEEQLQQERDRLDSLINSIQDEIWFADLTGVFTLVNPAGKQEFSLGPEVPTDVLQLAASLEVLRPDGTPRPVEESPPLRALRGETVINQEEIICTPFSGELRYRQVNASPVNDAQGKIIGSVSVVRDITPLKKAEFELRKLNEELEARVAQRTAELRDKDQMLLLQSRQAAMGEMIGNIAHQWRQPLNALGLVVQQFSLIYDLGELNAEFVKKSVSSSMELIKHMSKTIDDFRNYFRPDKEKAEFKVREAIANTVSLIGDNFKNQHINIEVIAKDDPSIFGYRNEFAQAILNILNNAKDALKEREIKDPRVTINICIEGDRAVVTIADNAGGIPEEIMRKIFDPYFTTKGPQDGTGIGLFMSKAIIEKNMGGRLAARNIADGVEFRIEV